MRLVVCYVSAVIIGWSWVIGSTPAWVPILAAFAWGFAVGGAHMELAGECGAWSMAK